MTELQQILRRLQKDKSFWDKDGRFVGESEWRKLRKKADILLEEQRYRRIEQGYLPHLKIKEFLDGKRRIINESPKGIQNWYNTRTLVDMVTKQMDHNERASGVRRCRINNKWQLQIRGKHLRRLLKAMPNVRLIGGNLLIEERNR